MTLITVKPLVSKLLVGIWPLLSGITGLTDSCWTVNPDTFDVISLSFDLGMVFSDHLELSVVLNVDVLRDLVKLTGLRVSLDSSPIGLAVAVVWLSAKLPGSLYPSVLLEAVARCSVVDLDWLKVSMFAVLLQCSETGRLFACEVELNVNSLALL